MPWFRLKPQDAVEAVQYRGTLTAEIKAFIGARPFEVFDDGLHLVDQDLLVESGWWIILQKGIFRVCPAATFDATYEQVGL